MDKCVWVWSKTGLCIVKAGCGEYYEEKIYPYCPYCGKKIEVKDEN